MKGFSGRKYFSETAYCGSQRISPPILQKNVDGDVWGVSENCVFRNFTNSRNILMGFPKYLRLRGAPKLPFYIHICSCLLALQLSTRNWFFFSWKFPRCNFFSTFNFRLRFTSFSRETHSDLCTRCHSFEINIYRLKLYLFSLRIFIIFVVMVCLGFSLIFTQLHKPPTFSSVNIAIRYRNEYYSTEGELLDWLKREKHNFLLFSRIK